MNPYVNTQKKFRVLLLNLKLSEHLDFNLVFPVKFMYTFKKKSLKHTEISSTSGPKDLGQEGFKLYI